MDIKVTGANMKVGDALHKHVTQRLEANVKKYFEKAVNADVFFTKNKNSFQANIIVNEGVSELSVKSDAEGVDVYGCFDDALEKAAKQLRRYKRKMKSYRRGQGGFKSVDLSEETLEASE